MVERLTAEQIADHLGVTPYSDMREYVVHAVNYTRETDAERALAERASVMNGEDAARLIEKLRRAKYSAVIAGDEIRTVLSALTTQQAEPEMECAYVDGPQGRVRIPLGRAQPAAPSLPVDRDTLGRMVREAWVRWALTQPNPKPSWLLPYSELSETDKEADRQIGEAIAKWTLIHSEASRFSPAAPQEAEAVRIGDAVLDWMVKYDLLDGGNEYSAADVIAVLNDLTPSNRSPAQAVTEALLRDVREDLFAWMQSFPDADHAASEVLVERINNALTESQEAGR